MGKGLFQGTFLVKIIFIVLFAFHFVCDEGAKALVCRTARVLAQIKMLALSCTNNHYVLYFRELTVKKKDSVSLKNVLDKTVKIINFIEYRPLSTLFFNTLYDEMESTDKALLLHSKVGKMLCHV